MDVVLNPVQGEALVEETGVRHAALRLERRTTEEAEGPEAVVESDVDDAVAAILLADLDQTCRVAAVVVVLLTGRESTTVDPAPPSVHVTRLNRAIDESTHQTTTGALAVLLS